MFRGSSTPRLAKYASLSAQNDGFVGVHYNKTRYVSAYGTESLGLLAPI